MVGLVGHRLVAGDIGRSRPCFPFCLDCARIRTTTPRSPTSPNHWMIDERRCYKFIVFSAQKAVALQPSLDQFCSIIVRSNNIQLPKTRIFDKKRPPSRGFARCAHVPLGLQPCLVDKRRSRRTVVSNMCARTRNVTIPTPPQPIPPNKKHHMA